MWSSDVEIHHLQELHPYPEKTRCTLSRGLETVCYGIRCTQIARILLLILCLTTKHDEEGRNRNDWSPKLSWLPSELSDVLLADVCVCLSTVQSRF